VPNSRTDKLVLSFYPILQFRACILTKTATCM
jgi:hypothetical protein